MITLLVTHRDFESRTKVWPLVCHGRHVKRRRMDRLPLVLGSLLTAFLMFCLTVAAISSQQPVRAAPVRPAIQVQLVSYTQPRHLSAFYWARTQAGHPYVWGGTGPGYDCSGLVVTAYAREGIRLPHSTYAMLSSGMLIRESSPRPGDLAFFGSGHVELVAVIPRTTFGALDYGRPVWWHPISTWWHPSMYFRVRGAG